MSEMKLRACVTDHTFDPLDVEARELQKAGIELVEAQCPWEDEAAIIEAAGDCDAIIVQNSVITRRIIEGLPRCKVISLYGVGLDPVDVAAATEHGVVIANVPDYCINEVADHAMALLLSCLRKTVWETIAIRKLDPGADYSNMNYGGPLFPPVFKLKGLVLGLVGFGNVSRAIVARARAFRLNVIACDPLVDAAVFEEHGVERVDLDALLSRSDAVSLHLPLNDRTTNMIGTAQLAAMKSTAFLVNTARGAIVDEDALYRALKSGQIAGAALDVTVDEPIGADNPLLTLDNLVITNHIGYYSEGCLEEVRTRAAEEVCRVLSGGDPLPVAFVNPGVDRKR